MFDISKIGMRLAVIVTQLAKVLEDDVIWITHNLIICTQTHFARLLLGKAIVTRMGRDATGGSVEHQGEIERGSR